MKAKPIILNKDQQTEVLNALGVTVTVLADKSCTGAGETTLQSGTEGTGPPPHRHAWDESFYILSGSVRIHCDGEDTICKAGSFVHIPAGIVHAFSFGKEGGSMLEFTGRDSRAIELFTDLDQTFSQTAPDLNKAVEVLANNGVQVAI